MSIIELATMRAKAGRADDMGRALPVALSVIGEAEGCLAAAALRCVERPDEFVLRIQWVSVAAHEAFRETAEFAKYRAAFADHLGEVVGFAHYQVI
ncbi:putative quinol monooxygenase [Amycolatopsis panacis]|nr:antibiotic biosynthesis monooxygenase family protein [Amycolatopsis panacis]